MFTDSQLEKYAEVLVFALEKARIGGKINKYENVLLRFDIDARPLAEKVYKKLLERRLNVVSRVYSSPYMDKSFYDIADDKQLKAMLPGEKEFAGGLNGLVAIRAAESLTHLKNADPKKMSVRAIAGKPIRDIMDKREELGKFSWTLCGYPTKALAQAAGLTVNEYAGQIVKACFLDEKDPVSKWKEVFRANTEISKWLSGLGIERVFVESKSVDLEVKIGEKRKFISASGCNIPSFEIFTSPDWRGTKGIYFSDLKSYRSGNLVKNVRLEFKDGKAVKIQAGEGENFVKKILATDEGACQMGEFSLTDRRFSRINKFMADTLFDENFGGAHGNCHIAVGSSYSDTYAGDLKKLSPMLKKKLGFNYSSIHWDLVNTEDKTVTAVVKGGAKKLIYENGSFKY